MVDPAGASPLGAELDGLIALLNAGRLDDMVVRGEPLLDRFPQSFMLHDLLGLANSGLERFEQAARCFRQALKLKPDYALGHRNLGIVLQNMGCMDEAITCYQQVVSIAPDDAGEHYNLGAAMQDRGRMDEAVACYRRAIAITPQYGEAHFGLGNALGHLGHLDEAVACFEQVVRISPDHAPAYNNLGILLDRLSRLNEDGQRHATEAIACYEQALGLDPDYAEVHYNLGFALQGLDRLDEAIVCYRRALRIRPDFAEVHFNLGNALRDLGDLNEAVACYEQAVRFKSDYAEAYNNLGIVLERLDRMDEAIAAYERASGVKPDQTEAHHNLGAALLTLDRKDEAVAAYERASVVKPDQAEAHHNLGAALLTLGRLDEAIACFARALTIRPDYAEARCQKLFIQALVCDWGALASDADLMATLGVSGNVTIPFAMLPFDDNPERNRIRAEKYAAKEYPRSTAPILPSHVPRHRRIRIGYFSADFHNHATMYLMARLFELHDRSRFSVRIFSYGPDANDEMRQRLKDSADAFHDVRLMGDKAVAELARAERIDIAIDLKGYTLGTRLGIFAHRAAPVQLSYLGYPGTLGTQFIDYIVADRVVIPEDQRQHYSEKLILLPNSYQVNDDSRLISDRVPTRAEMGLPEDGFIFCCFNNAYKISPETFDIWMRLLDRVEGSVLWLFKANRWADGNLREEAKRRGIDPGRVIFADRVPGPEHLARHRLADLFLDCFNYNAHTTASDALWAGLPLVTRAGHGFAARVAASLLTAVGLPELITTTSDDYERLALELAENGDRLAQIREKLEANRVTETLFNSALFARHIEAGYQRAYDSYWEGSDPADILIA